MEPLKELFWRELNYDRANTPLSRRGWKETPTEALAEDPLLLATGGNDNAFHVIYCKLAYDELLRGPQRSVVNCMLKEDPYALFVFSNRHQTHWNFLNVKYEAAAKKRKLFRRITIKPEQGLRTASERIQMLDLGSLDRDLFGLSALSIQRRHDEAFDVEKVTKDFYREIANWYFWALKHIHFPKDAPKEKDGLDHVSVIRLITRLIFCWFIKEKGLIPESLFDERELKRLLVGFEPNKTANKESVFYRAILQNLFFATLNTEMDKREWTRDEQNFMAHSLYRFKECFHDPTRALDLFRNIPFLNGGLFECLDKDQGEKATPRYLRIDGFSRRTDSQVTAPDYLFFGPDQEVDLSEDYGDKKFRKTRVRGLIKTLNRYKFTIEENTPFDQEVALDPELCGKVFENLLAAYNPETGTTARKATGSFYTPREIVDYMVDEALIAFLKNGKDDTYERKLRKLFSWEETEHDFSEDEVAVLIDHIDSIKVLDPAVGSGAFPMGILYKLVFILNKLDPDNERWKVKQISRLDDIVMREEAVRIFRDNYDDYGRKLYLIENCIYGIDIQPIAVQIAKMRFFISLVVEQKVDEAKQNLGVRALPNLETKFVAANTLIGIEKPKQLMLRNLAIDAKEAELRVVREKHFNARTPKSKSMFRELDKQLRAEIAELLEKDGWDHKTAKQLSAWDPYDQNTSADFFDPEWMFGVRDGFDVVIGNPPYGFRSVLSAKQKKYFRKVEGVDFPTGDIAELFILKTLKELVVTQGIQTLIIPKKSLYGERWTNIRKLWYENQLLFLMDASQAFENVLLEQMAFGQRKTEGDSSFTIGALVSKEGFINVFGNFKRNEVFTGEGYNAQIYRGLYPIELLQKIKRNGIVDSGDLLHVDIGISNITSHLNHLPYGNYPCVKGIDISRWGLKPINRYIKGEVAKKYLNEYPEEKKLIAQEIIAHIENPIPHIKISMFLDDKKRLFNDTCVFVRILEDHIDPRFIMGYFHSKFANWYAYHFVYNRAIRTMHFINYYVTQIVLPREIIINPDQQKPIIRLVDNIMAVKNVDSNSDTRALEQEIDKIVYQLYELTAEEIAIVEENKFCRPTT
ncbi:MAG: Eco57I restriction-modification methylase domain-containing protein [Candidatus Aminicenantes bacterium]|nr:Eco57I restriction-modification methylase domain-containing protein [Candidatus Aminicenantes bacterium]